MKGGGGGGGAGGLGVGVSPYPLPPKKRWKGPVIAVLGLVILSMLVPLVFLLGLHNGFHSTPGNQICLFLSLSRSIRTPP